MKFLVRLALLLFSATGTLWVLCLYGFAYRAFQRLGHWPIPMINDPKLFPADTFFDALFGIVFLGAFPAAFSLLAVPVALFWYRAELSRRVLIGSLSIYLVSLVLCLAVSAVDPGRCWEWVQD